MAHKAVEATVFNSEDSHFGTLGAAVCQHFASKGEQQSYGGSADGTCSYHADGFALQFPSEEHAPAATFTNGGVQLGDFPHHVEHQADGQFAHRCGGVACGVADFDAALLAACEVNVVETGEGNGKHLQFGTGIDDVGREFDVGDDNDVAVSHAFLEREGILVAVQIIIEFMAFRGEFFF